MLERRRKVVRKAGKERKEREYKRKNMKTNNIIIYIYITSKEMVVGAKGKGILNEGKGD